MDTYKIITGININVLLYFARFYKMISMVMKNLLYIHKKIIIFFSIFLWIVHAALILQAISRRKVIVL